MLLALLLVVSGIGAVPAQLRLTRSTEFPEGSVEFSGPLLAQNRTCYPGAIDPLTGVLCGPVYMDNMRGPQIDIWNSFVSLYPDLADNVTALAELLAQLGDNVTNISTEFNIFTTLITQLGNNITLLNQLAQLLANQTALLQQFDNETAILALLAQLQNNITDLAARIVVLEGNVTALRAAIDCLSQQHCAACDFVTATCIACHGGAELNTTTFMCRHCDVGQWSNGSYGALCTGCPANCLACSSDTGACHMCTRGYNISGAGCVLADGVIEHIVLSLNGGTAVPGFQPSYESFRDTYAYSFEGVGSVVNSVAVIVEIPENWMIGTDIFVELHAGRNAASAAAGNAIFTLTYDITPTDTVVQPAHTVSVTVVPIDHPRYEIFEALFPALNITGITEHGMLNAILTRNAGATGDTTNTDVFVFTVDLFFQTDPTAGG